MGGGGVRGEGGVSGSLRALTQAAEFASRAFLFYHCSLDAPSSATFPPLAPSPREPCTFRCCMNTIQLRILRLQRAVCRHVLLVSASCLLCLQRETSPRFVNGADSS